MASPLEQCRELIQDMEDAEGKRFTSDQEEQIDELSEIFYAPVSANMSSTGELDFPKVSPLLAALVEERYSTTDGPDPQVQYAATLLAHATAREFQIMEATL